MSTLALSTWQGWLSEVASGQHSIFGKVFDKINSLEPMKRKHEDLRWQPIRLHAWTFIYSQAETAYSCWQQAISTCSVTTNLKFQKDIIPCVAIFFKQIWRGRLGYNCANVLNLTSALAWKWPQIKKRINVTETLGHCSNDIVAKVLFGQDIVTAANKWPRT